MGAYLGEAHLIIDDDTEKSPVEQWLGMVDLQASVSVHLPIRDLATACSTCSSMRSAVVGNVVPARLAKARRTAEEHAHTIRDKPAKMGALEYLQTAEEAAEAAVEATRKKKLSRKNDLGGFADHVLVEAAMRGKLQIYEPRIEAIQRQADETEDPDECERLFKEVQAIENEILFGGLVGLPPPTGPGGAAPPPADVTRMMQMLFNGGTISL